MTQDCRRLLDHNSHKLQPPLFAETNTQHACRLMSPSETVSHETPVWNCHPCKEHLKKHQVYVEAIIHSNRRGMKQPLHGNLSGPTNSVSHSFKSSPPDTRPCYNNWQMVSRLAYLEYQKYQISLISCFNPWLLWICIIPLWSKFEPKEYIYSPKCQLVHIQHSTMNLLQALLSSGTG